MRFTHNIYSHKGFSHCVLQRNKELLNLDDFISVLLEKMCNEIRKKRENAFRVARCELRLVDEKPREESLFTRFGNLDIFGK